MNDAEMDKRAKAAVRSAINRAEICQKPVAKYDRKIGKAYIETANREKNMSDRKPMVLVLAGPNGSGKSTITRFFDIVGIYTNADDMVAATGMSNEDAARLAEK